MKVLHLVENLNMGGAERVVVDVINHSSEDVHAAVCCLERSGAMASLIRRSGVRIFELGKTAGNDVTMPLKIARLLKEEKIDVLHSHNWATLVEAGLAGCLHGASLRIHTQHGESVPAGPGWGARLKKAVRNGVEQALAGRMDAIISVSDQVRRGLIDGRGLDPSKITVVRNGIEVRPAASDAIEAKRRELGLSEKDFVIISAGRLAAVKNYPLLIESVARLRAAGFQVKLLMAGDGPERAALEELIGRLNLAGDVRLLGARQDLPEIFGAANVFVVSSVSEGISIALLEAMAAGLPVVATKVGGNNEVVVDGETGLLVPSENVEAMAAALTGLLKGPALRARMSEAAIARVKQHFNIERTVTDIEKIYATALEKRSHG